MNFKINQKYLSTVILSFISLFVSSQELYITNGITFSSAGEGVDNSQKSYQIDVGLNYLKNKWYFLSSNIGLTHKGGDFYKEIINEKKCLSKETEKFNYRFLSIGTLFNFRKRLTSSYLFLGCGPRLDFRINNPKESDIEVNKTIFGFKYSAGYNYYISNFIIGLNANYYPSFTKYYKHINKKDQTFSLGISLGYNL